MVPASMTWAGSTACRLSHRFLVRQAVAAGHNCTSSCDPLTLVVRHLQGL